MQALSVSYVTPHYEKTVSCYLGIDVGTQGLTALLVESKSESGSGSSSSSSSLNVLAIGEGSYDFIPGLEDGCYEQEPTDWEIALVEALKKIQQATTTNNVNVNIEAICVTGQMHGCVMIDKNGNSIGTARLWCDSRNQEEVRNVM
jgi:xylulokinase